MNILVDADGFASGFWMRIDSTGLYVMRTNNDAQMSVTPLPITKRSFAAMNRNPKWLAGPEWLEIDCGDSQKFRDDDRFWAEVMRHWNMDATKTYETFEGSLPVRVARRLGLLRGVEIERVC